MAGVAATCVGKVGAFTQRFFSEVVASVITTACVAGATTIYLQWGAAPPVPTRDPFPNLAGLMSPMPEFGTEALVRAVPAVEAPAATAVAIARPPLRPRPADVNLAARTKALLARHSQQAALYRGDPGMTDDVLATPLPPIDGPATDAPDEAVRLVPPPEPAGTADQTAAESPVFGGTVPAAMPYGEDVARRMRGWTASVTSLLP